MFFDESSNWDTSSATDLSSMFQEAKAFNIDISSWDVSQVTTLEIMLEVAVSFSHDLSSWGSSLTNLETSAAMFRGASAFSHSLCWDLTGVLVSEMFTGSGLGASVTGSSSCSPTMVPTFFGGCTVGQYAADGSCIDCEVGKYFARPGYQTACLVCAMGKFTNRTGQSSCENCPTGRYNADDATAASEHDAASDCLVCSTGKYADTTGKTECTDCAAGTIAAAEGAVECDDCAAGTIAATSGLSACTDCQTGTIAATSGLSTCTECAKGTIGATSGLSACTDCRNGTIAAFSGLSTCTECQTGTIAASDALSTCTNCQAGTIAATIGLAVCTDCTAGTIAPLDGASTCTACDKGTIAASDGLSTCTDCVKGTIAATSGLAACTDCSAGTIAPLDAATACTACDKGTIAAAAALFECTPCVKGTIAAAGGLAACTNCAAGTIAAEDGATACTDCGVGTIAASAGSSACTDCALGTIAASAAQAVCTDCPGGKIANLPALSACADCPAGFVAESSGLSVCTACVSPTYATAGSKNCSICVSGYVLVPQDVLDARDDFDDDEPPMCQECPLWKGRDKSAECTTIIDGVQTGVKLETLEIEPGYFRISADSFTDAEIRPCPMHKEACQGGTNFTTLGGAYCSKGYEGPYCDVCSEDYYKDTATMTCKTCEESSQSPSLIIFLIVLAGVLILITCRMMAKGKLENLLKMGAEEQSKDDGGRSPNKDPLGLGGGGGGGGRLGKQARASISGGLDALESLDASELKALQADLYALFEKVIKPKLKIMTAFAQLVTSMTLNLNVDFPVQYTGFLSWFDFVNLSLFKVVPVECVITDSNYYRQLLITTILPLILGAIILALHACHLRSAKAHEEEFMKVHLDLERAKAPPEEKWDDEKAEEKRKEKVEAEFAKHQRKYFSVFLLLSYLILPTCSSVILMTFKCDTFDDIDTAYMHADLSVVCHTIDSDGEYDKSGDRMAWEAYAVLMVSVAEIPF